MWGKTGKRRDKKQEGDRDRDRDKEIIYIKKFRNKMKNQQSNTQGTQSVLIIVPAEGWNDDEPTGMP